MAFAEDIATILEALPCGAPAAPAPTFPALEQFAGEDINVLNFGGNLNIPFGENAITIGDVNLPFGEDAFDITTADSHNQITNDSHNQQFDFLNPNISVAGLKG